MKSLENVLAEALQRPKSVHRRMAIAVAFSWVCRITALCSVFVLGVLLYTVSSKGMGHLTWSFLTSSPHPDPDRAGIWPALMGTFWTCVACGVLTLPIGIGTAIFLEELRPRNRLLRCLHSVVQLNGGGTDPQSRPLTYLWSLTTKPNGSTAALSSPTSRTPTFTADLVGNYVAQLIVNNGVENSLPATVTITTTNTAPVANADTATLMNSRVRPT